MYIDEKTKEKISIEDRALKYATGCHLGQFRKKSEAPYIVHPVRVAGLIKIKPDDFKFKFPQIDGTVDDSINLVCAAYLHDVIEDCYTETRTQKTIYEDIKEKFGEVVVKYVWELTNRFTKENCPTLNRKQRKQLELERIKDISAGAKTIKCADRIDNLLDYRINGGLANRFV